MFAAACYVWLVLGPDMVITGGAPPARLPAGSESWNFIGTFRLADAKGRAVVARLYVEDSEFLGGWQPAGLMTVPNSFALHAVYRTGDGGWKHRLLLGYGRVRFVRVTERATDWVALELQPNRRISPDEAERARETGREVNQPFVKRVAAKDGVPIIED